MATKTSAASAEKETPAAAPPPPARGKRLLLVVVVIGLLAALGFGGWVYLQKRNADLMLSMGEEEEEEDEYIPQGKPTYLPLDGMTVNLADPGGDRVAQLGVTLVVVNEAEMERVKAYMPSIRSGILLLLSQRSADELLSREGKDKLAADILESTLSHFPRKQRQKGQAAKPVTAVLFTSFIVQ